LTDIRYPSRLPICLAESIELTVGRRQMSRQIAVMLYVAAMIVVIVGIDFGFFRNRFWERLAVNVGVVLVFGAFYFRFLRQGLQ
jgi:hypothetical protein